MEYPFTLEETTTIYYSILESISYWTKRFEESVVEHDDDKDDLDVSHDALIELNIIKDKLEAIPGFSC